MTSTSEATRSCHRFHSNLVTSDAGWIAVKVSSWVAESGRNIPRSVMTAVVLLSGATGLPLPETTDVTKSTSQSTSASSAQHDKDLTGRGGDLGAPPAPGRRTCGLSRTDDGAVEIAEAIDLGSGQEADVDSPGLEPVREDLGNTTTDRAVVAVRRRRSKAAGSRTGPIVPTHNEDQVGCMGQPCKVGSLMGSPMPTKQTAHRPDGVRR